jgi:hypothetical protein
LPRRLIVLLTFGSLLVFAGPAHAGWFPAAPIDGPNADIVSVGNVDLARDGTGAVGYIKVTDGAPQAWVTRISGGAWQAPVRLSFAPGSTTDVKVASGDGNRLAVAWIAGGTVYATVSPEGATPGGYVPAVALGGPGASDLDIDMGVNGAAYAIWQEAGNVVAARLQDTTWTRVAAPLDIDPAREAGTGALRPRVAVSAEGYAVATWGEVAATDGLTHVWGRRITGMNLSLVPQDLNIAGNGNADSPDIDIENDGSYAWIVFRQDIGGLPRTLGRRLVGSQYEAPEFIDGGVPSTDPKVDMNGLGVGYAAAQSGWQVFGSWLDHDHFQLTQRLDSTQGDFGAKPEVASTDRNDSAIAWRVAGADGSSVARARYHDGEDAKGAFGPEVTLSRPDLGPVVDPGVFVGADRSGDVAVAMVQGTPGARTLSVAIYDRPPGTPFIDETEAYKRKTRPELRWRPGNDPWGVQTFRIYMDGVQIGQTTATTLVPATPLTTGKHTWQVEAVDRAGQSARSRVRTLKIDATAPTVSVKVSGKRAAGKSLKIAVTARDAGGSGLDHVTVDYGDKSATSQSRTTRHRYRRGKFTLKVAAVDRAGNVTRKQTKLTIKQS